MFNNISFENLKSFKKRGKIKFAPITIICGPNSVGKSTLWKFLQMIKQSIKKPLLSSVFNLEGPQYFADYNTVFFNKNKEVKFSFCPITSKTNSFRSSNNILMVKR